jgi:hypothetical protein
MEPNYIHSHFSAAKSKLMTQKLNESPQDKHKAKYGETHQANYLIGAKGKNSETKCQRELFNDRTNASNSPQRNVTAFEAPVSPFKESDAHMRSSPHSPVKGIH